MGRNVGELQRQSCFCWQCHWVKVCDHISIVFPGMQYPTFSLIIVICSVTTGSFIVGELNLTE